MAARRIVVAGTGTDVGKTHVACAVIRAARARGLRASAYKPIETGGVGDAERLARACGTPATPPMFRYGRPISPHLAAREAGRPIEIAAIWRAVDALAAACDLLVVETAGGLFTPLGLGATNAELSLALAPAELVVVAPDRLGVLHDLGATLRAARAMGIANAAVVLSTPGVADASTGSNADELDALGIAEVVAVFPRAADDAPDSLAAGAAVLGLA